MVEGLEHDPEGRMNIIQDCRILIASRIGEETRKPQAKALGEGHV